MRRWSQRSSLPISIALLLGAARALAQEPGVPRQPKHDNDVYVVNAESRTYIRLFQRALLPGGGGTQVETNTLLPIHQYVTLRVVDLDSAWHTNSTDFELGAWGNATLGDTAAAGSDVGHGPFDGDVMVANVRYRFGPGQVRFGRQLVAGPLRVRHLDGISGFVQAPLGVGLQGYGGLTVLPRWNDRPGYHHLGSAADSLLRQPDALPEPGRTDNWMFGTRLYYDRDFLRSGVSFHDQTENGELGRREVGLDLTLAPIEALSVSGNAFLDTDTTELVEARAQLDVYVDRKLDTFAEYRHVKPALWLSRQSLFSVFTTDNFDELGGEVGYRPTSRLRFGVATYVQVFGGDQLGLRSHLRVRVTPDDARRLTLQMAYGRVSERDNGYYSARGSVGYRVAAPLALTAEYYVYLYDHAIRDVATSTVEAANVEWAATRDLRLLLGSSAVRSPYAALDVQTLLRVSYGLEWTSEAPQ